jgi:hypothetical protein
MPINLFDNADQNTGTNLENEIQTIQQEGITNTNSINPIDQAGFDRVFSNSLTDTQQLTGGIGGLDINDITIPINPNAGPIGGGGTGPLQPITPEFTPPTFDINNLDSFSITDIRTPIPGSQLLVPGLTNLSTTAIGSLPVPGADIIANAAMPFIQKGIDRLLSTPVKLGADSITGTLVNSNAAMYDSVLGGTFSGVRYDALLGGSFGEVGTNIPGLLSPAASPSQLPGSALGGNLGGQTGQGITGGVNPGISMGVGIGLSVLGGILGGGTRSFMLNSTVQSRVTNSISRASTFVKEAGRNFTLATSDLAADYAEGNAIITDHGRRQFTSHDFRIITSAAMYVDSPLVSYLSQHMVFQAPTFQNLTDLYQGTHLNSWVRIEDLNQVIAKVTNRYNSVALRETSAEAEHVAGNMYIYGDTIMTQAGQPSKTKITKDNRTSLQDEFLGEGSTYGTSINIALENYVILAKQGVLAMEGGKLAAIDARFVMINCGAARLAASLMFKPQAQLKAPVALEKKAKGEPTGVKQVSETTPIPPQSPPANFESSDYSTLASLAGVYIKGRV